MWALIGFSSSIVVLCLGIRALIRDTGEAWADHRDVETLLDWIMPGLVVLAVLTLAGLRVTRIEAGAYSALPLLTYIIAAHLPEMLSRRYRDAHLGFLGSARIFIAQNGRLVGVTIFLFLQGLLYPAFLFKLYPAAIGRTPTLSLFIALMVVGKIGDSTLGRLAVGVGKWKSLAPGDLYRRIVEIASRCDVEVDDVRVLKDYAPGYIGAFAHSGSSIGFSEGLFAKLNKEEVDAVIAHEVGHLADDLYWKYSYPAYAVLGLAWLGGVRYLEQVIGSLPVQHHWLQYVNWMAMFLLPGLAWRWYSRYSERKADSKVAVLDNSQAAISGYYKLYLLNELPLDRPWWSRILSTHPTLAEEIETIARTSGLTGEQVDEAKRRAEVEVESGSGDRYEMVFHEEPEAEIEKRGNPRVEALIWVASIVVACVLMFGSFFVAVLREYSGWHVAGSIIGGVVATAVVILLPIDAYNRRKNAGLRRRIRAKLSRKYGDECVASMLLVDAHLNQDERQWQGALIGVRDGRLVVLAESREVTIPLDAVRLERYTKDSSIGESARMVLIRYEVESVPQWAVIRNLGRPEKGLPRSQKDLEQHVRDLITGMGGTIKAPGKLSIRQVLVRAPLALLILGLTFLALQFVLRLAGLKEMYWVHLIVLGSLAEPLYAWVTKRPRPD